MERRGVRPVVIPDLSPTGKEALPQEILTRAMDIAMQHNGPDAIADDFTLLYSLSYGNHLQEMLQSKKIDLSEFRIHVQDHIVTGKPEKGIAGGNVTESVAEVIRHAVHMAQEHNEPVADSHIFDALLTKGNPDAITFITTKLREREGL